MNTGGKIGAGLTNTREFGIPSVLSPVVGVIHESSPAGEEQTAKIGYNRSISYHTCHCVRVGADAPGGPRDGLKGSP